MADAAFEAEITLPDGTKQKLNLVRQGDHASGVFDETQTAGDEIAEEVLKHKP